MAWVWALGKEAGIGPGKEVYRRACLHRLRVCVVNNGALLRDFGEGSSDQSPLLNYHREMVWRLEGGFGDMRWGNHLLRKKGQL